jgi:TonB family protein
MVRIALGVLITIVTSPAEAQSVRQCAPTVDSIARPCELDAWPVTGTQREAPKYPDILRQAGVQGEVRAEFIVDTAGRPIISTLRTTATHQLFATMVRNALPRVRFEPPRRRGIPVSVRVMELVEFRYPGTGLHPVSGASASTFDVDSTGQLRITVFAHIPFDSAAAPRLTEADTWAIYHVVADYLIRHEEKRPSAYCVRVAGTEPPDEFFARWSGTAPVVPLEKCPPTYTSMVAYPDSRRAPTGWVDPVTITLGNVKPWAIDLVILDVQTWQGTSGIARTCEVQRTLEGWKQVACVVLSRTVS